MRWLSKRRARRDLERLEAIRALTDQLLPEYTRAYFHLMRPPDAAQFSLDLLFTTHVEAVHWAQAETRGKPDLLSRRYDEIFANLERLTIDALFERIQIERDREGSMANLLVRSTGDTRSLPTREEFIGHLLDVGRVAVTTNRPGITTEYSRRLGWGALPASERGSA